jgi:hypothetical protein
MDPCPHYMLREATFQGSLHPTGFSRPRGMVRNNIYIECSKAVAITSGFVTYIYYPLR